VGRGLGRRAPPTREALPERDLLVTGFGLTTEDEARREDHLRDALAITEEAHR